MSGPARQQRSSPISKLNMDILWMIFSYNSHVSAAACMYKETEESYATNKANTPREETQTQSQSQTSALMSTRSCSQVCRVWRRLILSSPSIWANALELEYLNQPDPQDRWRNEVLARTGSAPLTLVGGTSPSLDAPSTRFLFFVLENQMHRVRSLSIYPLDGSGYGHYDEYERRLCVALNSPAPNLEHLSLTARPWATNWDNNNVIDLHALALTPINTAARHTLPRLHHVHVDGFRLSLPTGSGCLSLSGITELHLLDVRTLSTFVLFTALCEMALLQRLQLELMRDSTVILSGDGFGGDTMVLPTVPLPHLAHITLCTSFRLMQDVITHIVPSTACSLRFSHFVYETVYPAAVSNETSASHPSVVVLGTQIEQARFGSVLARWLNRQIMAEKEPLVLEIVVVEVDVPCESEDDEGEDEDEEEDEEERLLEHPCTAPTICLRIGSTHCPPEDRRTVLEFRDVNIDGEVMNHIPRPDIEGVGDGGSTSAIINSVLSALSHTDLSNIVALDLCTFWTFLLNPHSPIIHRLFAALMKNVRTIYVPSAGLAFLVKAGVSLTEDQRRSTVIKVCNDVEWVDPHEDEAVSCFQWSSVRDSDLAYVGAGGLE